MAIKTISPATGKLGILTLGMGAVATTFIADVVAARKGLGAPIGSLTQMGRIRLGKRGEGREPLIREFAPLAALESVVFGGWDIFEDNVYEAASHARVLDQPLLEALRPELEAIKPMSAVFDSSYVRNISGPNVKKGSSKMDVLEGIFDGEKQPELYGDLYHKIRINYYPPHGDNKESWDNIDIFGWLGYGMQIKINFLCRDSILAAPIVLDLALFLDLAQRSGMGGIQEWLSFYFKAPQTKPGLEPIHDVFKQLHKLENTLRHIMGEELITHLGLDYYEQ